MSMVASQSAGIRRLLQQLAVCMLMQVRCLTLSAICFVKHCVMQKPPKPYCYHSMAGCGRDKSRDNATSLMRAIYSGEQFLPLQSTLSLPTLAGRNLQTHSSMSQGGANFPTRPWLANLIVQQGNQICFLHIRDYNSKTTLLQQGCEIPENGYEQWRQSQN